MFVHLLPYFFMFIDPSTDLGIIMKNHYEITVKSTALSYVF